MTNKQNLTYFEKEDIIHINLGSSCIYPKLAHSLALFISSAEHDAENLREIIQTGFEGEHSRIVDFSLNRQGLVVTVS